MSNDFVKYILISKVMTKTRNYAYINGEGKLVLHTDNATFVDGTTDTEFANRTFEISAEDLIKIYAMLQDKDIITLITKSKEYVIVGKDVEKKRLMDMYVKLLYNVEEINNNRHWWERKIKIERPL